MSEFSSVAKRFYKYVLVHPIFCLFILALTLRIAYLFVAYNEDFLDEGDNYQYYLFAKRIIDYGLFSSEIIERGGNLQILGPGYPLIVSILFKLFGSGNFFPIFILNSVCSALLVPLVYSLAKEFFNLRVAFLASVWALLNPNFYRHMPFLLKESLIYVLFPLTIYILLKYIRSGFRNQYGVILGVIFALLIHTDERYLTYLPVFVFAIMISFGLCLRDRVRGTLMVVLLVLILMSPWLIRNYYLYDQVVILTSRTTKVTHLIWGKEIISEQGMQDVLVTDAVIDSVKMGIQPNQVNENLFDNIRQGLENGVEPYRYGTLEKYLRGFVFFWQPMYISGSFIQDGFRFQKWSFSHNLIGLFFFGLLIPFYFMGSLYNIFKTRNFFIGIISLLPLIQMTIHVALVHVIERYRVPIDFIVVLIGLDFALKIFDKLKVKKGMTENG